LRQNPINTAANAINETRFLIAGSELGNHFTRLENPSHPEERLKAKYTVCPRIEFTRGKHFLFLILRKNFRGITFFASSETPISVIKISVLIHCTLKLTFFVQIWS
jgi:hypothetical protein